MASLCEAVPVLRAQFFESGAPPDLHGQLGREVGVRHGAQRVVEGRDLDGAESGATPDQAVVLAVGVGVAHKNVIDGGVEQLAELGVGTRAGAADQVEAIGKAGAAVGGVLESRRDSQRLTEVLLVKASQRAVRRPVSVVALHEQERSPLDHARLHRRRGEPQPAGQPHGERLVLRDGGEALAGRFEDVAGGTARRRQRDPAVHLHDGQLRLGAGQGKTQAPFAVRQQRARSDLVEHADQVGVRERFGRRRGVVGRGQGVGRRRRVGRRPRRCLPFGPQRDGAGHLAADSGQNAEGVVGRHAQRAGHRVPLGALGQQTLEERSAASVGKRLGTLGQGERQGRRGVVGEPVFVVGEAHGAVTVESQGADDALLPPSDQRSDGGGARAHLTNAWEYLTKSVRPVERMRLADLAPSARLWPPAWSSPSLYTIHRSVASRK